MSLPKPLTEALSTPSEYLSSLLSPHFPQSLHSIQTYMPPFCTHNLMSSLTTIFTSLFPSPTPTVLVAGIPLTRPQTTTLLKHCTTLHNLIIRQTALIDTLPALPRHQTLTVLSSIQARHTRVMDRLADLVLATAASKESLVKEFGDVGVSLRRKIEACNVASRPRDKGWRRAAEMYWPVVLEGYVVLFDLVERLKVEIEGALEEQTDRDVGEVRVQGGVGGVETLVEKNKRVVFKREVKGRLFCMGDAVRGGEGDGRMDIEFVASLTSGSRSGKARFKQRARDERAARKEKEWDSRDGGTVGDEEVEEILSEGRAIVPL